MHHDRLGFLDAMRGWAILLVIFNHAGTVAGPSGLLGKLALLGAYGVQLFFVVSAFTIFLTYTAAKERERCPTANFFTRRLYRIVPVYWAGMVLYTLVYGLQSRGWVQGPGPEIWHYVVHALLLNVLIPITSSSVVPGGWSISVEVIFYLSMPLWIAIITTQRRAVWMFIWASVAGALLSAAIPHVLTGVSGSDMRLYVHRIPTNQLACFAAGIWLYFAVRDGVHRKIATPVRSAVVMAGSLLLLAAGTKWPLTVPSQVHIYALAFALAGLSLAALPWRLAVNRFTIGMGRISYSAYITHFLVLKALAAVLPPGQTPLAFLSFFALATLLTIPLAWIGYQSLESWGARMAKRIVAKRESRTLVLAPAA